MNEVLTTVLIGLLCAANLEIVHDSLYKKRLFDSERLKLYAGALKYWYGFLTAWVILATILYIVECFVIQNPSFGNYLVLGALYWFICCLAYMVWYFWALSRYS